MASERANQETLFPRKAVIALASFSALTAFAGGAGLVIWRRGHEHLPPWLLDGSPFHTFMIPGLLLGLVVGGSSLVAAVTAYRRSAGAVDALVFAGGTLIVWIAAECAILRELSWLQGLYAGIGLTLLTLGIAASLRSNVPRHRWIVYVTAAELVGFSMPALTAVVSSRLSATREPLASWVLAAGTVEGLVLGLGQARAFPFSLRTVRYAALTALGAGLAWGVALTLLAAAKPILQGGGLPVLAALAGLLVIGAAQYVELRHHVRCAHPWIGWTAFAWLLALPMSFLPGPFVDDATPITAAVVLWLSGGVLMAYVMAAITWQGVRRLLYPDSSLRPVQGRR